MRWFVLCFALLLPLYPIGAAFAQPAPDFSLEQNEPNPFCGQTSIRFAMHVTAEGSLRVWNPDSTMVVRTLVEGRLLVGYHEVIWDGRDDAGIPLPNGEYPYVLTAVEVPGDPPIFVASLRARIDCPTPIEMRTWGSVKTIYRDPPSTQRK
jgi:hypothetical protein